MKLFDNYKFTDRKHPYAGIMSAVLGVIGIIFETASVFAPYVLGKSVERYAMVLLLCFIYAVAGIILGIVGKVKKGTFDFFPKVGIIINVLVIAIGVVIIMIGAS